MTDTASPAIYNAHIPDMFRSRLRFPRGVPAIVILSILFAAIAHAEDWSAPAAQLAAKIVAATGPGAVAVDFSNRSSLSKNDFAEIRRRLLTELAASGVKLVKPEQAAATVAIAFSENLQTYVWVAEIQLGTSEPSVVMASGPRPQAQVSSPESAALAIRKSPLWSQQERILDVAMIEGNPAHMIVLDSKQATIYKSQDGRWIPEQSFAITHSRPWPRDLRGRLVLRRDHLFDAYLPGVFCRSTANGPLSMSCRESDDPWPLGTELFSMHGFFTPSRNFFTGALAPGVGKPTSAPPFYSAAALPRGQYTLWLLATVDGQVHLLDGLTDQLAGKLGWGSDLASVRTGCGSGWQVLATQNGDSSDAVRAFEFPDREPVAVSQPLELSGSITAMWTETTGSAAIAVSRNAETRTYEAFRLTITCGQ